MRHRERRYGDLGRAGIRRAAVADALGLLEEAARRLRAAREGRSMDTLTTRLCIVGGGPAGMMAGLLFARAGIEYGRSREARGFPARLPRRHDPPLHPRPDGRAGLHRALPRPAPAAGRALRASSPGASYHVADFSRLPTRNRFLSFMPQWDFLDFLAGEAGRCPSFRLPPDRGAGLIEAEGRVAGVRAEGPDGPSRSGPIWCSAPTGAIRRCAQQAGLDAPGLRRARSTCCGSACSRRDGDPRQRLGRFGPGRILITLDRGDAWQCAYVVPKGGDAAIRAQGPAGLPAAVPRSRRSWPTHGRDRRLGRGRSS